MKSYNIVGQGGEGSHSGSCLYSKFMAFEAF